MAPVQIVKMDYPKVWLLRLLKGITLYGENDFKNKDILICGDKILEIGENLNYNFKNIDIIKSYGKIAIPGYLDQHVHVVGGGGEEGFTTRVPELKLTDCIKAGVTTIVGLLGTDAVTRSVESLVAKTKALNEYGLTAYCLTGSYEYPSPTITESVKKDIVFIEEVIGVKIALSDHRSSHIRKEEMIKLASEARLAGLISKKPGIVHIHVGRGKGGLDLLFDILENENIPISVFRPTHVGKVYDDAIKFANMGGYIDFTTGRDVEMTSELLIRAMDEAPADKITLSTDSNGSIPKWNDKQEVIGMGVGKKDSMHEVVKSLVVNYNLELKDAIRFSTENVARALEIYPQKGILKEKSDADIILLDNKLNIDTVIAKGKIMMQDKEFLMKGNFE